MDVAAANWFIAGFSLGFILGALAWAVIFMFPWRRD